MEERKYYLLEQKGSGLESTVRVCMYYYMDHQSQLIDWIKYDGMFDLLSSIVPGEMVDQLYSRNYGIKEVHELYGRVFELLLVEVEREEHEQTDYIRTEVLYDMFSVKEEYRGDPNCIVTDDQVVEHTFYIVGEALRALESLMRLGEELGVDIVSMMENE